MKSIKTVSFAHTSFRTRYSSIGSAKRKLADVITRPPFVGFERSVSLNARRFVAIAPMLPDRKSPESLQGEDFIMIFMNEWGGFELAIPRVQIGYLDEVVLQTCLKDSLDTFLITTR